MTIPVAHDFICPWCYIAIKQVRDLEREFPDVQFEWLGYELMPENLAWPEPSTKEPKPENPNKAKTPTRMELAYAASGVTPPTGDRNKRMRSHNALESVEWVKAEGGKVTDWVEVLYDAYWERGEEINDLEVLKSLAEKFGLDAERMIEAIKSKQFNEKIVAFDDDAYAQHVYNVPTYWIGGEKYAEQPTSVLRAAIKAARESGS
jgi:predicted DsbA family dithiol-disulfide isomerase